MPEIDYNNLTSKGMVPNGIYTVLFQKVDNTPAGTGTPQTKFDLEIIAPATRAFAGVNYDVLGQKAQAKLFWSDKAMARSVKECIECFGMQQFVTSEEFQEECLKLDKCYIDVYIQSEERFLTETPEPGQPRWKAKVIEIDGKPQTDGWEITRVTFRPGTLKKADGTQPW